MSTTDTMATDFSRNLRSLCARRGSFAQACRDIGINRQQFNRYINGLGMPSVHNLHRIARHFAIREEELMLDHQTFLERFGDERPDTQAGPAAMFSDIFKNQSRHLRRFLGSYYSFFLTPTWPDQIFKSLIWLREQDGYVVSHTYERAVSEDGNIKQKTRYSGLVALHGNRIYLLERAFTDDGFISESVLFPPHRQQVNFLKGQVLGVAARPRLSPYSSLLVWKRIPESVSAREAVEATGIFPRDSRNIDPVVRNYLKTHQLTPSEGN